MTDIFKLIEANGLTLHGDIDTVVIELVAAKEREDTPRIGVLPGKSGRRK